MRAPQARALNITFSHQISRQLYLPGHCIFSWDFQHPAGRGISFFFTSNFYDPAGSTLFFILDFYDPAGDEKQGYFFSWPKVHFIARGPVQPLKSGVPKTFYGVQKTPICGTPD